MIKYGEKSLLIKELIKGDIYIAKLVRETHEYDVIFAFQNNHSNDILIVSKSIELLSNGKLYKYIEGNLFTLNKYSKVTIKPISNYVKNMFINEFKKRLDFEISSEYRADYFKGVFNYFNENLNITFYELKNYNYD